MASPIFEDDDDDFDEYNPHPYQGGYDIVATYGRPLPPSPKICHPIKPSSSPSPSPEIKIDRPVSGYPAPEIKIEHPASDYGWMDTYRPELFPSPDLFRNWPFLSSREREIRCGGSAWDSGGNGGWNWRKGLDYLFGHDQGYGERRIGVDSYGVPVYASRKCGGEGGVVVEVEPMSVYRADYHEGWDGLDGGYSGYQDCWPTQTSDESFGITNFAYNKHYSGEPQNIEVNPYEFHREVNYHEVYHEQHHYSGDSSSKEESSFVSSLFGSSNISYNRHFNEQAQHFYVTPFEVAGPEKMGHQDVYHEHTSLKSQHLLLSYHGEREDEINYYASPTHAVKSNSYEGHECNQYYPSHGTWLQNEANYEAKVEEPPISHTYFLKEIGDQDVYHDTTLESQYFLSYNGEREEETNYLASPIVAIKSSSYVEDEGFQYDPFHVGWVQNQAIYENKVEEQPISYFHSSLFGDQDERNTISGLPRFGYEGHYYDQLPSFQLEPYMPSWSQYRGYYNEPVYPISDKDDGSNF